MDLRAPSLDIGGLRLRVFVWNENSAIFDVVSHLHYNVVITAYQQFFILFIHEDLETAWLDAESGRYFVLKFDVFTGICYLNFYLAVWRNDIDCYRILIAHY